MTRYVAVLDILAQLPKYPEEARALTSRTLDASIRYVLNRTGRNELEVLLRFAADLGYLEESLALELASKLTPDGRQ